MESVGLDYWVEWQVAVCALIILIPTFISIRLIIFTTKNNTPTTTTYHHHLWMPYWKNLHPIWLFIYRLFAFVSMAYLLYQTVLAFGFFVFYFYTQSVTIYFSIGTIIYAQGCWMIFKKHSLPIPNQERDKFLKKKYSPVEDSTMKDNEASTTLQMQFNQEAGFWGNLMQNVYQVRLCLPISYFGAYYSHFRWVMISSLPCCLLACIPLILFFSSWILLSTHFSWHGLVYFVLWSATYIVFQWVMHACCFTWWPYPFLELATPWAPMWYFGIVLFHLPCYGLYLLLVKAKVSIFPRAFIRWLPPVFSY